MSFHKKNEDGETHKKEEILCWNLRTLPREIIKWIQGLDLSYSVKDPRKDLNNGFLFAEILSRYYPRPGVLNMHSFDNSQNFSRRKNNWELLDQFFKKNELPFQREDWRKILMDNDAETIIHFTSKLYQFLTQRKITKPPLADYINNKDFIGAGTFSEKQDGTTSFLLKDKGLEKIEDQKDKEKEAEKKPLDGSIVQSEKKLQISHASSKRTNFQRVASKPISQNIESVNYQIDVRKINIKPVAGSVLDLNNKMIKDDKGDTFDKQNSAILSSQKLQPQQDTFKGKESSMAGKQYGSQQQQQQQSISQYGTSTNENKGKKEKKLDSIMDVINTMLLDSLKRNETEFEKIQIKNNSLSQVFSDQINIFEDEFVVTFFMDIHHSLEAFLSYVQKDTNELWKFFNFMFVCLNNLDPAKECLKILVELIKTFGQKSVQKDAFKTKSIFVEFFLPQLAQYIKSCLLFEKKEMLFSIVYSFCTNDPVQRHQMICSLRNALNDQHTFMQSLVVLIDFEDDFTTANQLLFNDFKYFIRMNLLSSSTNLRTMSLALLNRICQVRHDLVIDIVMGKLEQISKNDWWENKCLAIIVFSKLIKGIINSEKYQNLIKNPAANQKFFSAENEKLVTEMKQQIVRLAQGIQRAALPSGSDYILSITFIYIIEHLRESKLLLELFIQLILSCNDEMRHWVLHANEMDNSHISKNSRNSHYSNNPINSEPAKQVEVINFNGSQRSNRGNNQDQQQNKSFSDGKDQYIYFVQSDKSLKYKHNIDSSIIKEYASDILMTLVKMIENMDLNSNLITHEYMELITYGFENTDFKIINVESCEKIADTLKEYIFLSLCDEDLTQQARSILIRLFELQFRADVKIKESEHLFASAISLIYESNFEKCMQQVEYILNWLMEDYKAGIDGVRTFVNQLYKGLLQRKNQQYRQSQSLMKILQPVIENFKRDESLNQNLEQEENQDDLQEDQQGMVHEESAIIKSKEEKVGDMGDEKDEINELLKAFQESQQVKILEAQKWTPGANPIQIEKNSFVPIPDCGYDDLILGLGWSHSEKKDLDIGILMLDKKGNEIDQVSYKRPRSKDSAIIHKGDNTSGDKEGDDEKMMINLRKLDPNVETIWVYVYHYDKQGQGFSDLQSAHSRITIQEEEFCNFNWVQEQYKNRNGVIVCNFEKHSLGWIVKSRGQYSKVSTPDLKTALQVVQQVYKGDLSNVEM